MNTHNDHNYFERIKHNPVFQKYKEIRKKSGQKILVFLFFVALSALIWFFNALGKNYSTFISFPVRYTNIPSNKVLTNDLPNRLLLKVNAKGNIILKYKLRSNINPVVFDVKSFASERSSDGDINSFHILTSLTRDRLQSQLDGEVQITDIEPDTLFFELAETTSKKVPVIPEVNISLQKQYMQKGDIQTSPDSVLISGPAKIIDTIQYVRTQELVLNNITDTVRKSIDIVSIPSINYALEEVNIMIFVERFTESELKIPIRVNNLPDTIQLKTFPRQVTTTFKVGLSDYQKISQEMFRAVVNFDSTLLINPPNKLDVKLEKYPGFVSSVNYYPTDVDYILEK